MSDRPKHQDVAICIHCREPIQFWDANFGFPGSRGEKWLHTEPNYCDETQAEPGPPDYCLRCGIPHSGKCKRPKDD